MSRDICIGVPGVPITISQIVQIANGASVSIHPDTATKVKKESPSPSAFRPDDTQLPAFFVPTSSGLSDYSPVSVNNQSSLLRADCVTILAALCNGRSGVRLLCLENLVEFLCTSPDKEGGQLSRAHYTGANVPMSLEERTALNVNHCPLIGTSALLLNDYQQLQKLAVMTCALSCEASKADVRQIEPDKLGASTSEVRDAAEQLQDLLQRSSRINSLKGGKGVYTSVLSAPSVDGNLRKALLTVEQIVKGLLTAPIPEHMSAALIADCTSLLDHHFFVLKFVARQAELSVARTEKVYFLMESKSEEAHQLVNEQWLLLEGLESLISSTSDAFRQSRKQTELTTGVDAFIVGKIKEMVEVATASLAHEAMIAILALKDVSDKSLEDSCRVSDAKESKKKKKGQDFGFGTAKFLQLLRSLDLESSFAELSLQGENKGNKRTLHSLFNDTFYKELGRIQESCIAVRPTKNVKVAKGARDFTPDQMAIREDIFGKITRVFQRHGAVTIDTPDFELKETLTGKYGEDSKLIYDLKDQGGELLSLRYDLTVPLARYVALHGVSTLQRYHIGKVHRRDQPQMARGRFREFYQCDMDIVGNGPLMSADADVLKGLTEILTEVLKDLKPSNESEEDNSKFTVKINHRKLLDGIMSLCGVPEAKFRTICSAIDKLDKVDWETVKKEMVEEKDLDEKVAAKIGEFVHNVKGKPLDLLTQLQNPEHEFHKHEGCRTALEEMKVLFDYLECFKALDHFSFDLSLARGLDYYTGVIFEVVLEGANVGSIAAGGRYDNLIGMFGSKTIPAVGISLGVERIFSILEKHYKDQAKQHNGKIRETKTQVLIMSSSPDFLKKRMSWANKFWEKGISVQYSGFKENLQMEKQMSYANAHGIPFGVVLREKELGEGKVEIMDLENKEVENVYVPVELAVEEIMNRLAQTKPLSLVTAGGSK